MKAKAKLGLRLGRVNLLKTLGFFGLKSIERGVLAVLVTGDPILLVGKHGTAKTTLCRALAAAVGLKFHAYDASKALFEDVIGFPDPKSLESGSVEYVPTPISLWDKEFILIDELSRAHPQMQNKWLEVIRSRTLMGHPLSRLKYIFAAMNPPDYLGAMPLDEALLSRFAVVLKMPEAAEMDEADVRLVMNNQCLDDAPLLGALAVDASERARSPVPDIDKLLDAVRLEAARVNRRTGRRIEAYIIAVMYALKEKEIYMDGRRLGMLRRNLTVWMALSTVEDERSDLYEVIRDALFASIPLCAVQPDVLSESTLEVVHAASFEEAFGGGGNGTPARSFRTRDAQSLRGHFDSLVRRRPPLEDWYEHFNRFIRTHKECMASEPQKLARSAARLYRLARIAMENAATIPGEALEHLLEYYAFAFAVNGPDLVYAALATLKPYLDLNDHAEVVLVKALLRKLDIRRASDDELAEHCRKLLDAFRTTEGGL